MPLAMCVSSSSFHETAMTWQKPAARQTMLAALCQMMSAAPGCHLPSLADGPLYTYQTKKTGQTSTELTPAGLQTLVPLPNRYHCLVARPAKTAQAATKVRHSCP